MAWLRRLRIGLGLTVVAALLAGLIGASLVAPHAGWSPTMLAMLVASWAAVGAPVGFVAGPSSWRRANAVVAVLAGVLVMSAVTAAIAFDAWGFVSARGAWASLGGVVVSCGAIRGGAGARRWAGRRPRWAWLCGAGVAAVVGLAALATMGYARRLGIAPFASHDRREAFENLCDTLASHFSHWEGAPVGPEPLCVRYRSRIAAADAACAGDPCPAYLDAMRDLLAELDDGHTRRVDPWPYAGLGWPAIATAPVEGQLAITSVEAGSDAERAGVMPGMTIDGIDGVEAAEALAGVPAWQIAVRSPHERRARRYAMVLVGPVDQPVDVRLRMSGAACRTVTLTRGALALQPATEVAELDDGVVVIQVRRLWDAPGGPSVAATFDRALEQRPEARGVVLDLRGNGGGDSRLGDHIAGRFLQEAVEYGQECYLAGRHPMRFWAHGCFDLVIEPRAPRYDGPVAVLLDASVASSAEWLAAALCDGGRARCFGSRTAGDSGNPIDFAIPGGLVQYSTGNSRRSNGTPFLGRGVPVHEEIRPTLADLRVGRDPVLDAAVRWLRSR